MSDAKIGLSQKEEDLVTNASLILTKNAILDKIKNMLADLQQQQLVYVQQITGSYSPFSESSPKISKGEKYKGLPYIILDYPRIFHPGNIFAIRTMFWWGNFFSVTLQLSGTYQSGNLSKLSDGFEKFRQEGFFVSAGESQWEHDFEIANYIPIATITPQEFKTRCQENSFIKIAAKIPLENWAQIPEKLMKSFCLLMEVAGT